MKHGLVEGTKQLVTLLDPMLIHQSGIAMCCRHKPQPNVLTLRFAYHRMERAPVGLPEQLVTLLDL